MGLYRRNRIWWVKFQVQGREVRASTGCRAISKAKLVEAQMRIKAAEDGGAIIGPVDIDQILGINHHPSILSVLEDAFEPIEIAALNPVDAPGNLMRVTKYIRELPPILMGPAIYFLCSGREVVYVGKSIALAVRIMQHRTSKEFDRVYFLQAKKRHLDYLESYFVQLLKPRLNGRMPVGYLPQGKEKADFDREQ